MSQAAKSKRKAAVNSTDITVSRWFVIVFHEDKEISLVGIHSKDAFPKKEGIAALEERYEWKAEDVVNVVYNKNIFLATIISMADDLDVAKKLEIKARSFDADITGLISKSVTKNDRLKPLARSTPQSKLTSRKIVAQESDEDEENELFSKKNLNGIISDSDEDPGDSTDQDYFQIRKNERFEQENEKAANSDEFVNIESYANTEFPEPALHSQKENNAQLPETQPPRNHTETQPPRNHPTQDDGVNIEIVHTNLIDAVQVVVAEAIPQLVAAVGPECEKQCKKQLDLATKEIVDSIKNYVDEQLTSKFNEMTETINAGFRSQSYKSTKIITAVKNNVERENLLSQIPDFAVKYKNAAVKLRDQRTLFSEKQLFAVGGVDFTKEIEAVFSSYKTNEAKFAKYAAWQLFGMRSIRFWKLTTEDEAKRAKKNTERMYMWHKTPELMKKYEGLLKLFFNKQIKPLIVLHLDDELKKINSNPTSENHSIHTQNVDRITKETEVDFRISMFEKVNQAAIDSGHYRNKCTSVIYWTLLESEEWKPYNTWTWKDEIVEREYMLTKGDRKLAKDYKGHKRAYEVDYPSEGPCNLLNKIREEQRKIFREKNSDVSDSDESDDGRPPMKKKKYVSNNTTNNTTS